MTERNRRVVIILLVIFAGGGLVCLVCGVAGVFRMQEWGAEVQRDAVATVAEADEFARTHDQLACRDEGLRRGDTMPPTDFTAYAQVAVFTQRCLDGAASTPGFCDGVPDLTDIMASARWAAAQCTELGRVHDSRCTSLLQSVQRTCHPTH